MAIPAVTWLIPVRAGAKRTPELKKKCLALPLTVVPAIVVDTDVATDALLNIKIWAIQVKVNELVTFYQTWISD